MFKSIRSKINQSQEKLREAIAQYIIFHKDSKQLILTPKTVGLLCQQAQAKIQNVSHLEPHSEVGLMATIQHNNITAKLHFTPDKITIKENEIEGQLQLLNSPKFETDSLIYRYLIAGWQSFLGGKIPERALPKGVRVEKNYIYYTFPREDAKLLNIFFPIVETDSVLNPFLSLSEIN